MGLTWEAGHVAIAAFSLGQVHGVVCGPQQGVRIRAILWIEADADAYRGLRSVSLHGEGDGKSALDLQDDRLGISDLVNRFHDDHELVTADTGDHVALAHALREPLCNGT
jgi:hypothetical protein